MPGRVPSATVPPAGSNGASRLRAPRAPSPMRSQARGQLAGGVATQAAQLAGVKRDGAPGSNSSASPSCRPPTRPGRRCGPRHREPAGEALDSGVRQVGQRTETRRVGSSGRTSSAAPVGRRSSRAVTSPSSPRSRPISSKPSSPSRETPPARLGRTSKSGPMRSRSAPSRLTPPCRPAGGVHTSVSTASAPASSTASSSPHGRGRRSDGSPGATRPCAAFNSRRSAVGSSAGPSPFARPARSGG